MHVLLGGLIGAALSVVLELVAFWLLVVYKRKKK